MIPKYLYFFSFRFFFTLSFILVSIVVPKGQMLL